MEGAGNGCWNTGADSGHQPKQAAKSLSVGTQTSILAGVSNRLSYQVDSPGHFAVISVDNKDAAHILYVYK